MKSKQVRAWKDLERRSQTSKFYVHVSSSYVDDNTTTFYVSVLSSFFCLFLWFHFTSTHYHPPTLNTQLNPLTSLTTQSESIPPPQDVTCTSPSSTSLLLSWAPPPTDENGIVTGYSIRYVAVERDKDPVQRISDIPSNCFRYRIEGLKKGTLYSLTIAAHTDTGQGPESLPILVRTDEDGMSVWQWPNLKLNLPFLHLLKTHLPYQVAGIFLISPKQFCVLLPCDNVVRSLSVA